jgi:hypothetical protein
VRQRLVVEVADDELDAGVLAMLGVDVVQRLEASSHCPRVDGGCLEEWLIGANDLDSEAFSASLADVDGVELAALDTLQHGLARDAEDLGCFEHRQPAGGRVFDEAGAQLVVDADLPRCGRGVSCSPAMKPSASQRWIVDGATSRISAALVIATSSPSGGSAGGWWRGMSR